jgi:hypothetical protein
MAQRDRGPFDPLFESRNRTDFTPLPQQTIAYNSGVPALLPGFQDRHFAAVTGPDVSRAAITNGMLNPPAAGSLYPQIQNGLSPGIVSTNDMKAPAGQQYQLGIGKQATGLAITGPAHQELTNKVALKVIDGVKSDVPTQRLPTDFIEGGVDASAQKSQLKIAGPGVSMVNHTETTQLSTTKRGDHKDEVHHTDVQSSDPKGIRKPKKDKDDVRDTQRLQRQKQEQEQTQKQQHERQQQLRQKQQKHLGMKFEELRKIFKTLDVNNDHSITHREFIRGLKNHPLIAAKLGTF